MQRRAAINSCHCQMLIAFKRLQMQQVLLFYIGSLEGFENFNFHFLKLQKSQIDHSLVTFFSSNVEY